MTEHQIRLSLSQHSELITAIILILSFGFGMYELYVHTEYFSDCIKSHKSEGGSSMTRHTICDESVQVKNQYYRSTYP